MDFIVAFFFFFFFRRALKGNTNTTVYPYDVELYGVDSGDPHCAKFVL